MGREARGMVTFGGTSGAASLHLDSTELTLRGAVRARIARRDIAEIAAGPGGLTLRAGGELLHVGLPQAEAARWATALATPPPSLADKLGIGPDKPAVVLGTVTDPALAAALQDAVVADPASATVIVASIRSQADLAAALAAARDTGLPLWCIYPKGKAADPGDAAIRALLRAAGLIDSKSCAVSEVLTATRYRLRG